MKFLTRILPVLFVLFVLFVPVNALAASSAAPQTVDVNKLLQILMEVLNVIKGMTALATAITLLVNFCKSRGWIKDSVADVAFQIFNLVAILGLTIAKYLNPSLDFGAFDALLQALLDNFAIVLPIALVTPAQLAFTKFPL